MRRLLLPCLLGLLVIAAPAEAATVSLSSSAAKVKFKAALGESNDLTVTQLGALRVRIRDPRAVGAEGGATTISAGGTTCEKVAGDTVECTLASSVWRVQADLDDGDDAATVDATTLGVKVTGGIGDDTLAGGDARDELLGGDGHDVLDGGAGADAVSGGAGDDTIRARDGVRDTVACDEGSDGIQVDVEDTVAADCERVDRPIVPPTVVEPPAPAPVPAETSAPRGVPAETVAAPAPVPGRTVAGTVARGTVRVKAKGAGGFTALDPAQSVPVGATVDARDGVVALTSAADLAGRTQTARFTGGIFTVSQKRGKRMTTVLTLRGALRCGGSNRATARASAKGRRKSSRRRLWGSGHGRFTTRGQNSQASVRGTIWTVEDRCDGTLTRVQRGKVLVEDFATGRKRMVRAGGRYLARNRTKNAR